MPGQWQSTDSSPFWDVDGLYTNGVRTFNYSAAGTDNQSTKANLQYFGPNSQGFINIDRFPHAGARRTQEHGCLGQRPREEGPDQVNPSLPKDSNKGQDYALRVDQYEAQDKFNLVGQPAKDNSWMKAGINIWDQQEVGDRQANNTVHCYTAKAMKPDKATLLPRPEPGQGVHWNTFEVTPTLEGRFGNVNVQYSHTLRVFSANDQTVLGVYTDGSPTILNGIFPYATVPQSLFNMDKLKIGFDLNEHNHIYTYGYFSEVENGEAGVSREQGGVDLRDEYRGQRVESHNVLQERQPKRQSPDRVAECRPNGRPDCNAAGSRAIPNSEPDRFQPIYHGAVEGQRATLDGGQQYLFQPPLFHGRIRVR